MNFNQSQRQRPSSAGKKSRIFAVSNACLHWINKRKTGVLSARINNVRMSRHYLGGLSKSQIRQLKTLIPLTPNARSIFKRT